MKKVPCKGEGCNTKIIFGIDEETGKTIPLDSSAPVYCVDFDEDKPRVRRVTDCFVSHFATCKRPNAFSKGGN